MNEHLPYEDELKKKLEELPLASEDMAWEDMKRRLKKDDEDRPIVPLFFKGCGSVALLVLLVVMGYLFTADPFDWFHKNAKEQGKISSDTTNVVQQNNDTSKVKNTPLLENRNEANDESTDTASGSKKLSSITVDGSSESKQMLKNSKSYISRNTTIKKNKPKTDVFFKQRKNSDLLKNKGRQQPITKNIKGHIKTTIAGAPGSDSVINDQPKAIDDELNNEQAQQQPKNKQKDAPVATIKGRQANDSIIKKSVLDTANIANKKQDSIKEKKLHFAAGLGLQQLIPIAGQKTNPYNSSGRKNSLGDYIPSLFVRMYKEEKWFIQSEFRYGAPQYTKGILFKSTPLDTTGGFLAKFENSSIKKTYYHQLPLSFNYFVLPNLSIGAGVSFNKFKSAIVNQEVFVVTPVTQVDSLLSTATLSQKKSDSNFVNLFTQGLIDIQYRRKRLSVGARYSFGLQPYLKFNLPGGEQRRERNSSLQIFLKYELWRSRK
ncbi:MAG: hypothetical protein ABIN67_22780 [Ferruginibacter sp.]